MNAFAQIAAVWGQWPTRKKISVVVGGGITLAIFGTLVMWTMQPSYVPLMTNLSPEDADAITQQLQGEHIAYQIAASGSAIMVPADQVHEIRLRLAGQGIPRGAGVGFEIFDERVFGVSRFTERVNYVRALQGELQRTIRELGPVRNARVHIVLPERRLFQGAEEHAQASVTVNLHPGRRLTAGQVQAIVHLVASSVEGLTTNEVTVVDSAGDILHRGGGADSALSDSLEYQRNLERSLEDRVAGIVARVVGAGKSSVHVSTELDLSQHEKTVESYDPEAYVIRSEQVSESSRGGGAAADGGGVPGVRANLTGAAPTPGTTTTGTGTQRSQTRNYEINKVISREVKPGNKIARLTVAVLVDQKQVVNDKGETVFQPLSTEEIDSLRNLIKSAVGFDESRGDQVEVQSLRFSANPEADGEAVVGMLTYVNHLWRPVAAVVLVILLAIFLLKRRSAVVAARSPQMLDQPRTVRELEATLEPSGATSAAAKQQSAGAVGGAQPAHPQMAIVENVKPQPSPSMAAAVLRNWLKEA